MVCLSRPYPFKFLKAVFHKFELVHSWILGLIYSFMSSKIAWNVANAKWWFAEMKIDKSEDWEKGLVQNIPFADESSFFKWLS